MKTKTIIKNSVICGICIAGVIASFVGFHNRPSSVVFPRWQYNYLTIDKPTIKDIKYIAHSGACTYAPENTVPAIRIAGEKGFYGTEFDIYCTKDGKWVLMHDKTINRMTNGTGHIEDYTYDELMKLSIDSGTNYKDYPNLKIPLLEEALDECKKHGLKPYIEIKGSNTENVASLLSLLKEKGFSDCTILSFQLTHLQQVKKLSNSHKLWFIVENITPKTIEQAKSLGKKAGIDFNASKKGNTAEKVRAVLDADLEAGAWVVDDKETLERVLDYGVKYITTNSLRSNDCFY